MNHATTNVRKGPQPIVTTGVAPELRAPEATHPQPLGVTAPRVDRRDSRLPYAVTSRIGALARTERYSDRRAAARGAEQMRRDLALLAARLDGRR